MSDFSPSIYQQRIYDWCNDGPGHAVLNAVAGSGKTTTLLQAARSFAAQDKSTIFVAFSNEIVKTAKERLAPDNTAIEVSTIHKIGRATLARYLGNLSPVQEFKYNYLVQDWIKARSTGQQQLEYLVTVTHQASQPDPANTDRSNRPFGAASANGSV